MELGTSRSFMLLRVARTEPQAQLEGWFCAMAVSLAQLPPAALMEAELFSSLGARAAENGISGQFIRSEDSRMVVDGFGNFYGATVHGGDNDDGAVYKFTP